MKTNEDLRRPAKWNEEIRKNSFIVSPGLWFHRVRRYRAWSGNLLDRSSPGKTILNHLTICLLKTKEKQKVLCFSSFLRITKGRGVSKRIHRPKEKREGQRWRWSGSTRIVARQVRERYHGKLILVPSFYTDTPSIKCISWIYVYVFAEKSSRNTHPPID